MADNVTLPGTGAVVGADEVSIGGVTQQVQRVKLVDGTDGGTDLLPGTADRGLRVDPAAKTLRSAPSSAPAISTSAYAVKDAVGTLLEWTNINRASGRSILIQSLMLVDRDQERAAMDLVLFRASITTPTDNAVFDPTDAELADCVGVIPITAGAYADFNDNSVASINSIGLEVSLSGTSLYGVLVARMAPTYTANGDLQGPYLTVIQD